MSHRSATGGLVCNDSWIPANDATDAPQDGRPTVMEGRWKSWTRHAGVRYASETGAISTRSSQRCQVGTVLTVNRSGRIVTGHAPGYMITSV